MNKYLIIILILSLCRTAIPAQEDAGQTDYNIDLIGAFSSSGNLTPFWIVSNKNGVIPLKANNGLLRAGINHNRRLSTSVRLKAGADVVATTSRYRDIYVQQLYAGLATGNIHLTIGSKENYTSLWDRELSSGDLVISSNARPVPEINISIPQFMLIPFTAGTLFFKGDFAVGRSFDNDYLTHFTNGNQTFIRNTLWHHKSLFLRFIDTENNLPFTATIGIRHYAQWGGTSSDPGIGRQPASFKDFIRVILGKSGDASATLSDRINVLGNHYGSYDFKFGYLSRNFDIHIYKQHYFEDNSGMEFFNYPDGLYGLQINLPSCFWFNKAVLEFLNTRHQSGPIHLIDYDRDKYPGFGGGNDDYYNNGEYTTGTSYFTRSLGSPLLTSPEYNKTGRLRFSNTRVQAWHAGLSGNISKQVAYKILATYSNNWGTMSTPFLCRKNNFSCSAKITYCHPKLNNWNFSAEVAADFGKLYNDNSGICFTITRHGILQTW
jgi:hypothetical protein